MSSPCPDLVVLGPSGHGVSGYASDLAAAVVALVPTAAVVPVPDADALVALAREHRPLHVHVTDHLLGSSPSAAADVVESVAALCEVSVTLHDIPQPSDGPGRLERRAAGYGRIARAARRVVVCSEHERALVRDHVDGDVAAAVHVVPLGTARAEVPPVRHRATAGQGLRVLVAGWVYPGKGHLEAARAAVLAAPVGSAPVKVVAIGGSSPGHEQELENLRVAVAAAGAELEVTGVLDRAAYREHLWGAGVPVVAHQHLSASRTLIEWAEHGRRALVLRSRYTREMDDLRPGLIHLVDPDSLGEAIGAAWRDPASTWLPASAELRPDMADAARAYLAIWRTP
ncbi:glycosyltransferase family protein [Cellulomonas rhizosphaerae]|uniref:D-inositol 3-phosphate glycosyltransferase n=1 Tax=Cellulomonas rhizosphaerae TaxID=2293719 RepID=A0A413RQM5_9CELL|nr:hypothetical protein [Cellulomonas rhizosphaerae]RHA44221.1 hypothetical protein D1825_02405 [Cellulomonas rhizosphaerae]